MKLTLVALIAICSIYALPVLSQDAPPARVENTDVTQAMAEEYFALFIEQAKAIELTAEQDEQKLLLREQPLQKFSSEGKTFGSVFLWNGSDKRPAVIGTLGSLPVNEQDFGFIELHWLLDRPMKPVTIGKAYPKLWRTSGKELATKLIQGAPAPAASAPSRMVQMRGLARDFQAQMTHREAKNELRLLPQPLYRYEDSSKETDGAIFAFVWTIGTDPEFLLHLTSRSEAGEPQWHWQPIRFTWRALEVSYKNTSVWSVEELATRNEIQQNTPYVTTLTEPITAGDPARVP